MNSNELKSLLNDIVITATSQFEQNGVSIWFIELDGHEHYLVSNTLLPKHV